MTNDPIEVLQKRLEMLHRRELLCTDEYRVLRLLVGEIKQKYMELPLDVDGVPVRPGDTVKNVFSGMIYDVEAVADFGDISLKNKHVEGLASACFFRHVKPDTVESLLEQFADEVADVDGRDREEYGPLLAKYAEKIKAVEG